MSRSALSQPDAAGGVILAFDTSGPWCACAVLRADKVLAQTVMHQQKGQAEALMPLIQTVLEHAGIGFSDLDGIGVGTGPGNFTGVRVAVAAARGLSLGLGIPAVGVSRFQAAAGADTLGQRVMSVPALRDQVYVQRLDGLVAIGPPELLPSEAAAKDRHAGQEQVAAASAPDPAIDTLAVSIARVVRRLLAEENTIPRPAPIYVRAADAAPSRDPAPLLLP